MKKILLMLCTILFTFSLSSCKNNVNFKEPHNEVTLQVFLKVNDIYNDLAASKDYTVSIYDYRKTDIKEFSNDKVVGEGTEKAEEKSNVSFDFSKSIATVQTESYTKGNRKNNSYNNVFDSKSKKDLTYQKVENANCCLDNVNMRRYESFSVNSLAKQYSLLNFTELSFESATKFFKDDNVYTASLKNEKAEYMLQIIVSEDKIILNMKEITTNEIKINNVLKEKLVTEKLSKVEYEFKMLDLTPKNPDNYKTIVSK